MAERRVFCEACETEMELFGFWRRERIGFREPWPGGPRTMYRTGERSQGDIYWCPTCRRGREVCGVGDHSRGGGTR